MPLPAKVSFESNKIPAEFDVEGLVRTRTKIKSSDGTMVDPIVGKRFLCLDDPEAVDAFRMRLDPGKAQRLDGLRVTPPRSGIATMAADGARLICKNVTLRKGQRLSFAWHFIAWSELPCNDFATFEATGAGPSAYGLGRHVLCDVGELAVAHRSASDWRVLTWTLSADFSGTLVWTVANGEAIADPAVTVPSERAFTNPPALLLDDIRVHG